MTKKEKRAAKKRLMTMARRKANGHLKSVYGKRWCYDRLGKSCASTQELLIELAILGEKNCGNLIDWADSRGDLPAPVPESVTRRKNKKKSYKPRVLPGTVTNPDPSAIRAEKKTPKKGRVAKTDDFLSSWEWRTLRYKVLQEYGRRCMCCGATPDDGVTVICVDHIKPRHTHPELSLDRGNLQVLCGVCNQGKGAWDQTDYRIRKVEPRPRRGWREIMMKSNATNAMESKPSQE